MECIFLNAAGTTLFVRNDMESGHWVQEQLNMTAEFPFVAGKRIEIGQRIAFRDPDTDVLQVFEIFNVENHEPEHYQQINAEHICVAELSDEHFEKTEITDQTAGDALATVLTGTLWSVGSDTEYDLYSGDFSRGSVWNAINTIQENWNVYITPRVEISSAGVITGRYLDISYAGGTWRGMRLSVRKNFLDPAVTYDESDVYTALYGYGGNVDVAQTTGDDQTEELTFRDEVWTATSEHPSKPANQTYLEWPEKTALYGRNGRPRYGYYQNGSIKDASVLLEKTWESLQIAAKPKISISGTVIDLKRLGYTDKPIRLHDSVLVEIEETNEVFRKQIICCDIDLIDPTGSRVQIGDYIPNIIYINRETDKKTSGGGGGGRGPKSMTNLDDDDVKTWTEFIKLQNQIGMVVGMKDGDNYIKAGEITLSINETTGQSLAVINADHVNISATNDVYTLAGDLQHDAQGRLVIKNAGGMYVQRTDQGITSYFGVFDDGNLTGGICVTKINGQSGTVLKLSADVIDIDGLVQKLQAIEIEVASLTVTNGIDCGPIQCGNIDCDTVTANANVLINGYLDVDTMKVGGTSHSVSWKSKSIRTCGLGTSETYQDTSGTNHVGRLVTSYSDETIYFLGY